MVKPTSPVKPASPAKPDAAKPEAKPAEKASSDPYDYLKAYLNKK
jgi:hypothetical protein